MNAEPVSIQFVALLGYAFGWNGLVTTVIASEPIVLCTYFIE